MLQSNLKYIFERRRNKRGLNKDNQNRFLWRLPSNPTSPESLKSNLRLPSYEGQTTSKIIKSRNLYISRVTSIRPYGSRVTESNNAPPELLQSNITSPEWRTQPLRLPSFFNQTLHLPSDQIKPYVSRVTSIKPHISRVTESDHTSPELLNQTINLPSYWIRPYVSRVIELDHTPPELWKVLAHLYYYPRPPVPCVPIYACYLGGGLMLSRGKGVWGARPVAG